VYELPIFSISQVSLSLSNHFFSKIGSPLLEVTKGTTMYSEITAYGRSLAAAILNKPQLRPLTAAVAKQLVRCSLLAI